MSEASWTDRVRPFLGQNYELDRLWKEHEEFEAKLAELDRIKWPTPEQDFERKRMQKEKLAGKDRMLAIVESQAAAG